MIVRAAAAAAVVAWAGPAPAAHVPPLCRLLRIARTQPGSDGVLLTFDDGPHPQGTPAVLRALDAAGARAVFFLVGEQIERDPGLAREIAAAGHELAVHGYRHRCLTRIAPWTLRDDLDRCAALVADAAGAAPHRYRPPYGIFSPAALCEARRRGWEPLLWSAWGRDWRADMTPDRIAALALRDSSAGGVLLLHDADHYSDPGSWRDTAAAVPRIIDGLSGRGLAAAAVRLP